jgi:hypothetical protein
VGQFDCGGGIFRYRSFASRPIFISWPKFIRSPSTLWQTRCGSRDTVGRYVRAAKFRCAHHVHMPLDAKLRKRPLRPWKGAWNTGGMAHEQGFQAPASSAFPQAGLDGAMREQVEREQAERRARLNGEPGRSLSSPRCGTSRRRAMCRPSSRPARAQPLKPVERDRIGEAQPQRSLQRVGAARVRPVLGEPACRKVLRPAGSHSLTSGRRNGGERPQNASRTALSSRPSPPPSAA